MDILYLESVIAVYHFRSFVEASAFLSLSVSSVSKHITAVERQLHTELFIRSTKARSISITDSGLRLIPIIEDIVTKYHVLERDAERIYNERSDNLYISYLSLIGTMGEEEVVSNFCSRYPNVNVIQSQSNAKEMIRKLHAGIIDGCFFFIECDDDYRKSKKFNTYFSNAEFGTICLFRSDKMRIGVPKSHKLANRESVSLSEMMDNTFIFNSAHLDFYLSDSGQTLFQQRMPNVKIKYMDYIRHDIVLDTVAKGGGVVPTVFRVNRENPDVNWLTLSDWNAITYGIFVFRRDVHSKAMLNFKKCVEEVAQKNNSKEV